METFSTAGKSGGKDLHQLRKRRCPWSVELGKVIRGRRVLLGWTEGSAENWRDKWSEGSSHSCSHSYVVGMKRAAEGVMLLPGSSRESCGKEWLV